MSSPVLMMTSLDFGPSFGFSLYFWASVQGMSLEASVSRVELLFDIPPIGPPP